MKIIFLGTPHFAENILAKLIQSRHEVVAVVCQPDKLVGRKQVLQAPPTKLLAIKHGIKVFQFSKIKLEGVEPLKALNADIMVTAAYGQMLSQEVLDITPNGVINVHGSVLPKYRGSSPIQWSLINGEKTLGVTILKTQIGMDDGPILQTKEFLIDRQDTVDSLMEKISLMGADLLLKSLDDIENGTAVFTPQDESKATKCIMLKKENAQINFNNNALCVENFIRGLASWPVAYCKLNGVMLKIYKAMALNNNNFDNAVVGEVVKADKEGIFVKCNNSLLRLDQLQLEGGKILESKDFVNGKKIKVGDILA